MKHRRILWESCVLMLCLCGGYFLQGGQVIHQPRKADAGAVPAVKPAVNYAKLPLSFEANQGQTDARVKFLSRGPGYTLFLTGDGVALELQGSGVRIQDSAKAKRSEPMSALQRTKDNGGRRAADLKTGGPRYLLRMKLLNANHNAAATGASELPGKANYFLGNDPHKWRTNVPTYAKVKYKDVYQGVDLMYYGSQSGRLEYDFVVVPGATRAPSRFCSGNVPIADRRSETAVRIAADGDLVIPTGGGEVHFRGR